eukprot:Skav205787  [mRNA]  locus=scaffold340:143912:154994:+ [translate_table: standard]
MRHSRAASAKEDRLLARQRCIGRIGDCMSVVRLSPAAAVAYLVVTASTVAAIPQPELCHSQEAVSAPGLLQAKKSAVWGTVVEESDQARGAVLFTAGHDVAADVERRPRRHSPIMSRFFGIESRHSPETVSAVWPLLAFTTLFLLFTCILVNHEVGSQGLLWKLASEGFT